MLKVYYADISRLKCEPDEKWMSSYRLDRLIHMKHKESRQQGIGAELLLNHAVREVRPHQPLPLDIIKGRDGKPGCPGLDLFFNISHSANITACCISDKEVGLDVQKKVLFNEKLARREFTDSEIKYIFSSADQDSAFTRIWARKESFLKAQGCGLRFPMSNFSVLPGEYTDSGYSVWDRFTGDFCFAVCVKGRMISEPEIIRAEL